MILLKGKKVSLTELFYDLIFVYALSQITHILLHHTSDHHLENWNFIKFGMFLAAFATLLDVWILQTFVSNHFGKDSMRNKIFLIIGMFLMFFVARTFNSSWEEQYKNFAIFLALINILIIIQYLWEIKKIDDKKEKKIIITFVSVLSSHAVSLIACFFINNYYIAITIIYIWVVIMQLIPLMLFIFKKTLEIDIHHFIERLNLLTIIVFGEIIVQLAIYFTIDKKGFDYRSIFTFGTIAALFIYYIAEFDTKIDHDKKARAHFLFFIHFPIWLSLTLLAVALERYYYDSGNLLLINSIITFTSITSIYIFSFINGFFQKKKYRNNPFISAINFLVLIGAIIISLCLYWIGEIAIISSFVVAIIFAFNSWFAIYKQKQNKKKTNSKTKNHIL